MILAPFNQKAIDDPKYEDADYVTGSTHVMDGGLMQNQGQGA